MLASPTYNKIPSLRYPGWIQTICRNSQVRRQITGQCKLRKHNPYGRSCRDSSASSLISSNSLDVLSGFPCLYEVMENFSSFLSSWGALNEIAGMVGYST
jgi:hypothetical protein